MVKQLMLEENADDESLVDELNNKKFCFMVNETFLTLNVRELMLLLELSNEQVLNIHYFFALEKPKPT